MMRILALAGVAALAAGCGGGVTKEEMQTMRQELLAHEAQESAKLRSELTGVDQKYVTTQQLQLKVEKQLKDMEELSKQMTELSKTLQVKVDLDLKSLGKLRHLLAELFHVLELLLHFELELLGRDVLLIDSGQLAPQLSRLLRLMCQEFLTHGLHLLLGHSAAASRGQRRHPRQGQDSHHASLSVADFIFQRRPSRSESRSS